MLVNSATGHGKVHSQMSLGSDEYQREVVSAVDVEDSIMPLTLAVTVVAVELAMSKAMGRYEISGTGIAKVHSLRLYQLDRQLAVLIVQ